LDGSSNPAAVVRIGGGSGGPTRFAATDAAFFDDRAFFSDGSASQPALAFQSDTDTGLFWPSSGKIGVSLNGVESFRFELGKIGVSLNGVESFRFAAGVHPSDHIFYAPVTGGPQLVADDSGTIPVFTFTNDDDTGMYRSGSNALTLATAGIGRVTISGTRVDLDYSGTDQEILRFNTERAWSFFQRSSGASTRLALVSATTSKNFDIEAPSGMFARFHASSSVSNSFFQAENVLVGANGSASSPSLRWAATSNTGIFYSSSANQIGFATAGTARVLIGTGGYANFLVRDNTTGSSPNVFISSSGGSTGVMFRSTSARKYKSHIDYGLDLASIKLKPAKFYREDDDAWYYGFIADDLADEDSLLGVYDDGEVENYDHR